MADSDGDSETVMTITSQPRKSDKHKQKLLQTPLGTLSKDIRHYQFFALIRMIESLTGAQYGESKSPKEDPVFLGQHPHINFATTTIEQLRCANRTDHTWVDVNFFGLLGPNGPMPLSMSEEITVSLSAKPKQQITDFYNIFHHRLLSLLYRAWANKEPQLLSSKKTQPTNSFRSNYDKYIGTLAGYGLPSLLNRDSMPDFGKLGHAAFLGGYSKHRAGLQNILLQLFDIPAQIQEFTGEWIPIPENFRCQLKPSSQAKQLGINSTLGKNSWQCQYKFQVWLGPLDFVTYQSCLPGSPRLRQINDTIKNYVGLEFEWEIVLMLKKGDIPKPDLKKNVQLGWTTWLPESERDNLASPKTYVSNVRVTREHIENIPFTHH